MKLFLEALVALSAGIMVMLLAATLVTVLGER